MKITREFKGSTLIFRLEGRLDTMTAPELEAEIDKPVAGVTEMVMDFKDVEYISSAGLRVLLKAQRVMAGRGGTMKVKDPCEIVMEVFNVTGFADVLTIE